MLPAETAETAPPPEQAPRDNESLLSQTPLSSISTPPTESGLDVKKARIIDGIILYLHEKIKNMFIQARIRARGGPRETPDSSSQRGNSSPPATITEHSDDKARKGKKRKLNDRDFDEDDEDDANVARPMYPEEMEEDRRTPAYACPYFKYNPAMYKSARNCPGPGWPTVHRVK